MPDIPDSIVCDTLVRLGLVGSAQIEKARRAVSDAGSNMPISKHLIERGIIEYDEYERARAAAAEAGSSPEALLGMTIGGFRIEKVVGQGGMGVVYRAIELSLDRPVALKVLPPSFAADTAYLQRFEREAKAAAKIHHPAVATIFGVGSDGPHQYIAMELLDGGTLKERIVGYGVPSEAERRAFLAQILDGLAQAHKLGVIHRDLKPDNILLTSDGRPKIADFGIARDITANGQVTLTGSGMMGSPLYMAPELWEGKPASVQTDLWALGITYWFACENAFPFHAKSPMEISRLVTQKDLPYKAFKDPVDRKVLSMMLARKPEKRAKSALEVLSALRPYTSAASMNLLAVTSSQRVQVKKTPLASQLLQQTVSRTREALGSTRGPSWIFVLSAASILTGVALLLMPGFWMMVGAAAAGLGLIGLGGSLILQRSQQAQGSARVIPPGSTFDAMLEASNALGRSTRLEAEPTIPVAPRGNTSRIDNTRREHVPALGAAANGVSAPKPDRAQRKREKRAVPNTTVKASRSAPQKQRAEAMIEEGSQPIAVKAEKRGLPKQRKPAPRAQSEAIRGEGMSSGEARTIVVPRDVATIHEALGQASSGDTVYVSAGRYTMEPSVMKPGVTLSGQSADEVTIIGDAAKGALITIKAAGKYVLSNLCFTMQNTGDEELAKKNELLRVRAGEVKLSHVTVRGTPGHALRFHGDVQAEANALSISGAKRHGVTVSSGAQLKLSASSIEKCEEGAALVMDAGSQLTLRECEFSACEKYGLAARQGGKAILENCKIAKHRQYGALSGDAQSVITLKDCQVTANDKHGLLALGGGRLEMTGGLLQGNGQAGAAAQNADSSLMLADVNARENKAYGAYFAAGAQGEVRGCKFFTNKESGISISDEGTFVKVAHTHMSENGASGLTIRKGARALLDDCTAQGNPSFGMVATDAAVLDVSKGHANDNGTFGVAWLKGASGKAEDVSCKRNRKAGIGVQGEGSAPTLIRVTCTQNDQFGGLINGGSSPTLEECNFLENAESGLAVWDPQTAPTVRNCVARANTRFGVVVAGGAGGLFEGNTCNGNRAAGIFLQDAGTKPTLRNNSANGNLKVGIFVNKETDPVLEWNVANGNPESNVADERG